MEQGIKEWVLKLSKDKSFAEKYEGKSAKEVAELAKKDGFDFTAEDFMDLQMEAASGGGWFGNAWEKTMEFIHKTSTAVNENPEMVKMLSGIVSKMTEKNPKPTDYIKALDSIRENYDEEED